MDRHKMGPVAPQAATAQNLPALTIAAIEWNASSPMSDTLTFSSRRLSQLRGEKMPQGSAGASEIRRLLIGRALFAQTM